MFGRSHTELGRPQNATAASGEVCSLGDPGPRNRALTPHRFRTTPVPCAGSTIFVRGEALGDKTVLVCTEKANPTDSLSIGAIRSVMRFLVRTARPASMSLPPPAYLIMSYDTPVMFGGDSLVGRELANRVP